MLGYDGHEAMRDRRRETRDQGSGRVTGRGARAIVDDWIATVTGTMVGRFAAMLLLFAGTIGGMLGLIYLNYAGASPAEAETIARTLWVVFVASLTLSAVTAWLIVLAHDRRRAAERETAHQNLMLREEIAAHRRTDRELQRAKEAAEAANQAKTRYLVAASHEFRSPLNAIYGYAQLLGRGEAVSAQEAARVIRRSSEHLTNLIEGLLEISRVESGAVRLSRDVVAFPAFLAQLVDMFREQANEKGIELRYTPAGRMPDFVRVDEKRLRQILINLVSNAIKYTQEGHAELRVRYRSQIATIEVIDTGIGIAPEDHARVFQPFERGHSPAVLAQAGVGLGLAITQVLARIMGGDIALAAEPGGGTRFTLRLMLPEPMEPPVSGTPARAATGYEGRRRTLLLVDDDPAQLAIMAGLLRPLGFTVHTAACARDAFRIVEAVTPDAALLDIQMPEVDGWKVAAALRARFGHALRIVMVSANAHELRAEVDGDARAVHDATVAKPVEFQKLLDTLAKQLDLVWTAPAGPPPAPAPAAPLPAAAFGAEADEHLQELKRLGRIGHVRGIVRKLDEMEAALPACAPLVAELRGRVDAFDLKTYLRMLEDRVNG